MADRYESGSDRGHQNERGRSGSYSRGSSQGRDFRRSDRFDRSDRGERRFDRNDRGERRDFNRGERGDRGFQRREDRDFNRGDRGYQRRDGGFQRDGERRDFNRGERGDRRFDRSDRGERRFDRNDRGERRDFNRGERGDRGFQRREDRDFNRGDRGYQRRDGGFQRDGERRDFNRGERGDRRFDRSDRGERRFDRNDRGERRDFNRGERGDRGFQRREDAFKRTARPKGSREEFIPRDADEPTIPAGVAAEELDAQALRALATLSGANRDIVARHLVMAGQLIDLDPELAYRHAKAAASRAGRVDVVREAAALTAYASGRYEEALREVRAMRRMRGDQSLRSIEADAERGMGRPERAIEIIDQTDTSTLDLDEQVELVLVSSGARADLGQHEVGLLLVDNALAALPEQTDSFLVARLMSVKADRLRELGRDAEADEVLAQMPEEEDPEIVDIGLYADADVDDKRSPLRGTHGLLHTEFDAALLDLDGTAYAGALPINHAAEATTQVVEAGMKLGFVTNNASRTPEAVAAHLKELGFLASPEQVMTSAMDVVALMEDHFDEGARVFVVGGEGLRQALTAAGYELVESADQAPDAVVQGFDRAVTWELLTEAAYAIQNGARFFATNLDATLPQERGFALGNGSLVKAVQHATHRRPIAAGKPEPGIYLRGAALIEAENPIAVGDRLETDIMGAVAAGIPAMHVLTGVHGARDVIRAPRGQRPTYLALDMRGLVEEHPRPKHHLDGTWTCGVSQVARVLRNGTLTLDGIPLTQPVTLTLDSYRALAAAAWEYSADEPVDCPEITVVANDDPAGILSEPVEDAAAEEANADITQEAPLMEEDEQELIALAQESSEETPAFLPGEEELQELLEETASDEDTEN